MIPEEIKQKIEDEANQYAYKHASMSASVANYAQVDFTAGAEWAIKEFSTQPKNMIPEIKILGEMQQECKVDENWLFEKIYSYSGWSGSMDECLRLAKEISKQLQTN